MFSALTCLAAEHDLRLVLLAGGICLVACLAAADLYKLAERSVGLARLLWLATAGVAGGCGAWATHFIAILAYRPGIPVNFDAPLTAVSLVIALIAMTFGLGVAATGEARWRAPAAGVVIGVGVGVMHYVGMSALLLPGRIEWSAAPVVASLLWAATLAAVSIHTLEKGETRGRLTAAAGLLALGIVGLHFAGMAAAHIVPDPTRDIGGPFYSPSAIAYAVAGATAAILALGLLGGLASRRLARLTQRHDAEMRTLAASESERHLLRLAAAMNNVPFGLCMLDAEGRVVLCNANYERIYGLDVGSVKAGMTEAQIDELRWFACSLPPGRRRGDPSAAQAAQNMLEATSLEAIEELPDGRVVAVTRRALPQGGVLSTHQDITDRLALDSELRTTRVSLIEERGRAEDAARDAQSALCRLRDAIDAVPEGLALYDAEDRFVLWNARYAEMYQAHDLLQPGLKFEDFLRSLLARGCGPESAPDKDHWLKIRMERHRAHENVAEQQMSDGRWIRISERGASDGGAIAVHVNITELKRREASFQLELADALKPLSDPLEIMSVASERLGEALCCHQVVYAEIDARQEFATIRREWSRGAMPTSIGAHRLQDFGPSLIANLQAGKTNAVDDTGEEPGARSDVVQETYRARAIGAFLSVPLVKNGRLVGLLSIHQREARHWSKVDIALAEETAERIWAAIQRARAEQALRDSEERLRFSLSAANAGVWEWDPVTNVNVWSDELWRLYGIAPRRCEPSLATWLKSIHPEDRERVACAVKDAAARGGELSVEWRTRNSERWLMSRGAPMRETEHATPRYMGVVIDITERKKTEERIAYLAHHDALTGLPNRTAFNERLSGAMAEADANQGKVAVLCLDLDRFKEVNDVYGHVIGDELLRRVSRKFQAVAEGAPIARIGGDEFTAIIAGAAPQDRAASLAERLRDAVAAPFDIDGREMRIGVSAGVAFYPDHGDMAALLANADAALYRAKAEGGDKACFFDAELDSRLRERHALLQDLQHAIERGELHLVYQPQAGEDGEIFGFEALLRWRHPRRGPIPPDMFIPIAEESGFIAEIGEWVLREACREAAAWPRALSIAVNLSPAQFRREGLPRLVHAVLLETGLAGRRLELEITEGVLVDDFSRVREILRQLKNLGVKVAMDDFGTGYSSLSYLHSFAFDKIKIDRSFVSSLHGKSSSEAIIRAIIGLGRGLGVPLIAEGVETEAQLAFLRSAGCGEAQGYLIGKPLAIEDYAALVGRETSRTPGRVSV